MSDEPPVRLRWTKAGEFTRRMSLLSTTAKIMASVRGHPELWNDYVSRAREILIAHDWQKPERTDT